MRDRRGVSPVRKPIASTLLLDLNVVNRNVSSAILVRAFFRDDDIFDDRWQLFPTLGICTDYAVTKRHEHLRLGWPSAALLLAEVSLPTGEHHLVLVASVKGVAYVLDNLRSKVSDLGQVTDYEWIRVQSASNQRLWTSAARFHSDGIHLSLLKER